MNSKLDEPLDNQELTNRILGLDVQLLAIRAELKVLQTIIVDSGLIENDDYLKAIVSTVSIILNETEKAGVDVELYRKMVQEYLPEI